ncbi:hypothetical protein [Bacteriovorax sp. DB6_IX]|uniref:hypothetical protein n=1 Tax=Bacteriovorax sp. DB6_IX TaxID=1353530 RepID=UPI00038A5573|nr:hypothetical protein [Bacteriovorax sp. DB6_IX]EQC52681.1 hypothetical protein M901_1734 [Bacteriovorax sp. DB6_IX]
MKLAIIGSGPLALEAAVYFYQLGASIKIFSSSEAWGGALLRFENHMELLNKNWSDLASEQGRGFSGFQEEINTGSSYLKYLNHIGHQLRQLGLVKDGRVKRVHKRFLRPETQLIDRSRLADLFRVVYQIDATEQVEKQRAENAEVFEKLGKDVVESLKNSIESFEDFDLVIDASGDLNQPAPMGASKSYALNEQALKPGEDLFYGREVLKGIEKVSDKTSVITFIGTGEFNLCALSLVREHFDKKQNCKIQLITDERIPFQNVDAKTFTKPFQDFQKLLDDDQADFKGLIEQFEKNIMEWKNLDSHIRAKTPRPTEPTPRVYVYNGAVVSSVDRLLDQKGIFTTIEGSELLGTAEQLKTLSSDIIFVDNGFMSGDNLTTGLNQDSEPGYFKLRALKDQDINASLNSIEKEIMKYFSKS